MAEYSQGVRFDLNVCPNCGKYADLTEMTGWCAECSPSICTRCGNSFAHDTPRRIVCSTCREKRWLEENADRIEDHIIDGLSYTAAKTAVRRENRPICLCCGVKIVKGFFCTTKPDCRKAFHRYKWRLSKGMTQERALR